MASSVASFRAQDDSGDGVVLRRHARAKSLRLRLDPKTGEAVLTLPKRTSQAEAMQFLARHQEWLVKQRARLEQPRPFHPGGCFALFGERVILVHDSMHRGGPRLADGQLVVNGAPEFFARRVRDFVREEAARRFSAQVHEFADALGVQVHRVTIRDTVSRWGSCSASRHINLSWRLAFAPENVARYVIAHEVAHCREMNHSPAFWMHVAALVGEAKSERRWLREHGNSLMRVGVAA